jgi:hypothetical protein
MRVTERSFPGSSASLTAKQGPTPCIEGNGPLTEATCSFCVSFHWLKGASSTNKEKSAVRMEDWGVTLGCFRTCANSMLRTGISENCLLLESSFSVAADTFRANSQNETPSFACWPCGTPATKLPTVSAGRFGSKYLRQSTKLQKSGSRRRIIGLIGREEIDRAALVMMMITYLVKLNSSFFLSLSSFVLAAVFKNAAPRAAANVVFSFLHAARRLAVPAQSNHRN